MISFADEIKQGIPQELPTPKVWDAQVNHAPKRKEILSATEKKLAIANALRYFPKTQHAVLAKEFAQELADYGRIYMYRFMPEHPIFARPIHEYPGKSAQAKAIMLMIQNNLDHRVAQHPHELITYGGNGGVFQNWAQYRLTMKYLSEMAEDQTLHMYSGHPMGLFPSSMEAPRVVVTNGMMIPNYSKPDDWERFNALGVTQYGQMTAGSFMYIGPQGIVHGTTITVMNAFRKVLAKGDSPKGKIFLTAGLGGMSGAQPKAGNIANCITVCAEVNPKAATKRHQQGWVDELIDNMPALINRVKQAQAQQTLNTAPHPCMHHMAPAGCAMAPTTGMAGMNSLMHDNMRERMGEHHHLPPADTDGVAAQAAVTRYQDSFKSPPAPAPVFNIGLGTTSAR